jgi:hypothetical protein
MLCCNLHTYQGLLHRQGGLCCGELDISITIVNVIIIIIIIVLNYYIILTLFSHYNIIFSTYAVLITLSYLYCPLSVIGLVAVDPQYK